MREQINTWLGAWPGTTVLAVVAILMALPVRAQTAPHERVFSQSKAAVEKILAVIQPNLAGRLPVLDGFAEAGRHPLDQYQRGYYQASVGVVATAAGGSRVRVSVKVTAWYPDRQSARGEYELLTSNGRLEEDVLDQLSDRLATQTAGSAAVNVGSTEPVERPVADTPDTHQPPVAEPEVSAPSSVSRSGDFSTSSATALTAAEQASARLPVDAKGDSIRTGATKPNNDLQAEAESLEEILKNQGHPKNLVAVKKSGTAVVATPSLTGKTLFLASMHDEFEMLDFNRDWVHVRISGLSRGWIWRNGVEMPEGIPDTVAQAASSTSTAAADLFRVVREETGAFPGDWEPLRGKIVKILSVQKVDDNAKDAGPGERLAYAKFLFDKNFAEISKKTPAPASSDPTGIVLIFDSSDGGMIAATMSALKEWKAGTLTDSALWHKCFFDPPETFDSSEPSGSQ